MAKSKSTDGAAPKRRQPQKERATALKKAAMLKALRASKGLVTQAIEMLHQKKIRMDRSTHYDWLKKDPKYKQAVEDLDDEALDFAEGKLHERMAGVVMKDAKGQPVTTKDGQTVYVIPPSDTALIWYTKTKGKKRGYIERQEITGKDGKDLAPEDHKRVVFKLPDGTEVEM